MNAAAAMDELLHSHRINPELLRSDAFDAFYEQRRRDLLELIGAVIGKPIAIDSLQPDGEAALPQIDEDDTESSEQEIAA
jgi:hypothetical protein